MSCQIINHVRSCLEGVLKTSKIISVYQYGRLDGRDRDFFVVLSGNVPFTHVIRNEFDVTSVGEDWLFMLATYRDPLLVEPMVTGTHISGDELFLVQKKIWQTPDPDCGDYLLFSAELFYEWMLQNRSANNSLGVRECARFAYSYTLFARHYSFTTELVTFAALRKRYPNLDTFVSTLKQGNCTDGKVCEIVQEAIDTTSISG